MTWSSALSIIFGLVSVLAALYAREQAKSARAQVAEAKEANRQAAVANSIAMEQLELMKRERESAEEVRFRFQPRRSNFMDYLDLVNDAPHDTYVLWMQLVGLDVPDGYNGIRFKAPGVLGAERFARAHSTVQILDQQGAVDGGSPVMKYDSKAQLVLMLKTEGVLYEVRTDLTLDDRGFTTVGTTQSRQS